jgi:hypothetical protein
MLFENAISKRVLKAASELLFRLSFSVNSPLSVVYISYPAFRTMFRITGGQRAFRGLLEGFSELVSHFTDASKNFFLIFKPQSTHTKSTALILKTLQNNSSCDTMPFTHVTKYLNTSY